MARLDELAEGIARVLVATPVPEPMPIDLVGESPAAATVLVRAIIDACERHGAPLSAVTICPELGEDLLRQHGGTGYEGVGIAADDQLVSRIAFFRFPISGEPNGTVADA